MLIWFQDICTKTYAFSSSNHYPISMKLNDKVRIKAQPFKFENVWMMRMDFRNVVKQTWWIDPRGSYMYKLVEKIRMLKKLAMK